MVEPSEARTGSEGFSSDSVPCPGADCGKLFASLTSVKKHWYHSHKGEEPPAEWSVKRSASNGHAPSRKVAVEKPTDRALAEEQTRLGESIGIIGAVVAAGLNRYKEFAITCQVTGAQVRVPPVLKRGILKNVKPFTPRYMESTLGHMVVDRSPQTASVIMRYAATNSALLGWVRAFNNLMHVQGDGRLVTDHAMALLHTFNPTSGIASSYVEWTSSDTMSAVTQENIKLNAKLEELQAQLVAARSHVEGDERGAGN